METRDKIIKLLKTKTQTEVAKMLKMSQAQISRIVKPREDPICPITGYKLKSFV